MNHGYQLLANELLASNIYRLTFQAVDHPIPCQPGQYVLIHQATQSMAMSVAEQPSIDKFCFHLRLEKKEASWKVGDLYSLSGPFGHCCVAKQLDQHLTLVAGGTGITPFFHLLNTLDPSSQEKPISLYWGVNHSADLYLHQQLLSLEEQHPTFHYYPVLNQPQADKTLINWHKLGLVHQAMLSDITDWRHRLVFASGPWPMVAAVKENFLNAGLPSRQLRSDFLEDW